MAIPFFSRRNPKQYAADDPIIDALWSEDKDEVIVAVNELTRSKEGSKREEAMIEIVREWENDDSCAALWSIIALGNIGSRRAMPILLSVLESDADIWCEATSEALTHIVRRYGEKALDPLEKFIERHFDNDPYRARIYAYEPFAAMVPNERAKSFLIWCFREDNEWRASIAHDLACFGDRRVTQLIRPALEFAIRSGDQMEINELREAYCMSDGIKFWHMENLALWQQPWEKRWERKLEELGKSEREIDRMEKERIKKIEANDRDGKFEKRWREEDRLRDAHPIRDFNIEEWVRIRERNVIEDEFENALRLLGFSNLITVEAVQTWISRAARPRDVLDDMLDFDFPSGEAEHSFLHRWEDLWNETPREEFQGLSPDDMLSLPEAIGRNEQIDRTRKNLRDMIDDGMSSDDE